MKRRMANVAATALATLLLAAGGLEGADTAIRTKLTFCRRTETPPAIDGNLDDACWKDAAPITDFGFLRFGDQKGPAPLTTVKARYDEEYLYLAFDCEEPDMDRFTKTVNETGPVYLRDCIECYIDTQNDDKGYVCLMMNVRNESYAEARIDMGWLVVTDNSFNLWVRWMSRGAVREDGWSIEARINWQDVRVNPEAGTVMGFNPCRWRFAADAHQYLCWSTIGGHQKAPADYGHMVLGDPPDDLTTVLRAIYPGVKRSAIELPAAKGLNIIRDGQTTFATYRDILSGRIEALDKRLVGVETMPAAADAQAGKAWESLAGVKERVAGLKASFLEGGDITEGESLGFLKTIDQSHTELNDIEWEFKRDALLKRFAESLDKVGDRGDGP